MDLGVRGGTCGLRFSRLGNRDCLRVLRVLFMVEQELIAC